MDTYIFIHNGENTTENIVMVHIGENISSDNIGNIYNLVDYINNNVSEEAELKFVNFTGNKLEFIVSAITRYKSIVNVSGYNGLIVGKKRIRGR